MKEKQISIRIPEGILKQAKLAAKMERRSFNAWTNTLIEKRLREIKNGRGFNEYDMSKQKK